MPAARAAPHLKRRKLADRPPIFIGDEVTATGFRLAGASVRTPPQPELLEAFRQARKEAELVLVSVGYARQLPTEELRQALVALTPLVLIIPDLAGHVAMRDLLDRLGRELGVQV